MAKISKNIVILAVIVLCTTLLVAASDVETAKTVTEKEVKNPYENSRVLIEAFVVEVKLDALYKAGVGPVGQRPNSVSMEKILKCLRDEDKAKVTAGAKIAVKNRENGRMSSNQSKHVEREIIQSQKDTEASVPKKVFDRYEINTTFGVNARVHPDSDIYLEFTFGQRTVGSVSMSGVPLDTINMDWASSVFLQAGKPSIVGATQNDHTVVFLVIAADIENK